MIRLSKREKLLAVGSAAFIAVWLLFTVAVKPALGRIETLNRVISEKQQELNKLRARSKEYIFFRDNLNDLQMKVASQQKNFELLPLLESLIAQCGLSPNVSTMKQQELPIDSNYIETVVEIKLDNVSLNQLVNLLYQIESSQVLARTKSLYIKRNPANKNLLNSVIEVHNAKLIKS